MKTKTLLLTICCLTAIVGCKKQLDEGITPLPLIKSTSVGNPKNPYSVTNMRKAFANLLIADVKLITNSEAKYAKGKVMFTEGNQTLSINKQLTAAQGTAVAQSGINATHYYIKFMPRNEADYSLLKRDSNLVTYPFPLDNEITAYSGNYRDPAVPAGIPTYQYAAIPVGYNLPNVPYLKLEDLYLPNEQKKNGTISVKGAGNSSYTVATAQLVNAAFCPEQTTRVSRDTETQTLMLLEEDCGDGGGGGGGGGGYPPNDPYRNGEDWRPNGRITLIDDIKGTIGVEGIKVRARRWFTTYTGITDANGYYAVDGWYTRPANYWLEFERYDFSVNNGSGGPREISGPKIEAAWNHNLTGYDKYVGTIFRAAIHYYYKDIQGLRRPPLNSFWATQMKIGAFDETNIDANGDHSSWRRFLSLGEAIHIYNPNRTSDEIYATTIHELAHAVHWEMDASDYNNSEDIVSESWAVGVQWVLTKMEYPGYYGRRNVSHDYTNVVMDLIDGPGVISFQYLPNGNYYQYGYGSPYDEVGYYNIVEIQNALVGVRNFAAWKNNIYYQYNNSTKDNLDLLFNHYYYLP